MLQIAEYSAARALEKWRFNGPCSVGSDEHPELTELSSTRPPQIKANVAIKQPPCSLCQTKKKHACETFVTAHHITTLSAHCRNCAAAGRCNLRMQQRDA